MITLGINGGIDFPYENEFNFQSDDLHDAAAALVVDGEVVSAVEEERLNRIKHSNKTSIFSAAKFLLADNGITIGQVDKVCYYMTEETCNNLLRYISRKNFIPVRQRLTKKINEVFKCEFDEKKLGFVPHHIAHAVSTYALSGFENSLILAIDGSGDGISGMILQGEAGTMEVLDTISLKNSLGRFYNGLIKYLGFSSFDEYKVMGLAPYGNPGGYRYAFDSFYKLLSNGGFEIKTEYFPLLNHLPGIPREKGEPFTQIHKDVAASIQESLEKMVFHLLKYYKETYNHQRLCLAGGVAQNCTMNGKILNSGMFEDVFVQPASTDAGTAVGAALYTYFKEKYEENKDNGNKLVIHLNSRLQHVYWGTDIGTNDSILEQLKKWETFVEYEKVENITKKTAELLAEGFVIGWVQGRSEFGPRALGNRSILADPRPAENKEIINAMVKKREAFRPFAPSVLGEYVEEYYEVPGNCKKFPFMTFVLNVKKEKKAILAAVTHVDGTARIQTVSKDTNQKYWQLIEEFRKITGIPVLLNTSFNNNVEPIVNTFTDAVVCYLTTRLHYLVVGDYLIKKKEVKHPDYLEMVPSIPLHIQLNHTRKLVTGETFKDTYEIRDNFLKSKNVLGNDALLLPDLSFGVVRADLSGELYSVLKEVDGKRTFKEIMTPQMYNNDKQGRSMAVEIVNLWTLRLIKMRPNRLIVEEKKR